MPVSVLPKSLLVIAKSARMLVQMCKDIDCVVVAVDCFADSDTREMALQALQVRSLALDDVQAAVEFVAQRYGITQLLYGSGFEGYPETLAYLQQHFKIVGNSAAVFQRVQDKRGFFAQLASLSIPYPDTEFSQPVDAGDWLVKPWQGEGGSGIKRFRSGDAAENGYWQRYLAGRSMSVLFAANVDRVEIVGINQQWCMDTEDGEQFTFAGIASHAEISDENRRHLEHYVKKLSAFYALQGLNSLDFILHDGVCYVLEINARISASAQLYGKSILLKHLYACLGQLADAIELAQSPGAYQIVYAQKKLVIPDALNWLEWTADRPCAGAIVGAGEPICSIIASGKNSEQVLDNLHQQQLIVENILETGR